MVCRTGTRNGGSFASAFVCVSVRPLLHRMIAAGFGLSEQVLVMAGGLSVAFRVA